MTQDQSVTTTKYISVAVSTTDAESGSDITVLYYQIKLEDGSVSEAYFADLLSFGDTLCLAVKSIQGTDQTHLLLSVGV